MICPFDQPKSQRWSSALRITGNPQIAIYVVGAIECQHYDKMPG
jgi:hypothetical protein